MTTTDTSISPMPSTFMVKAYRCRCGHEWVPKDLHQAEAPRVCPKCKSHNWDRPYQFRRKTTDDSE